MNTLPPRPELPEHFRHLHDSLLPLREIDPALAEASEAFILYGDAPEILVRLNSADFDGRLLGQPGRLGDGIVLERYAGDTAFQSAKDALQARNEFYAGVDPDNTPIPVLRRLGRVLEAVDRKASLPPFRLPVPDWAAYLIADVLSSSVRIGWASNKIKSRRPGWRIRMIGALLAEETDGLPLALLLPFERPDIQRWHPSPLLQLLDWPDCDDWYAEHAGRVRAHYARLSATGRLMLTDVLGGDRPLAGSLRDLLVPLAVDGAKAVRDAAVERLSMLPEESRVAGLGRLLRAGPAQQRIRAAALLARVDTPASHELLQAALDDHPSPALEEALRAALDRLVSSARAAQPVSPGLPPAPSAQPAVFPEDVMDLLRRNWREVGADLEAAARREMEDSTGPGGFKFTSHQHSWNTFQALDENTVLRDLFERLNGAGGKALRFVERRVLLHQSRILQHPAAGLGHLFRVFKVAGSLDDFWAQEPFQSWLARQAPGTVDLRLLAAHMQACDGDARWVAAAALGRQREMPSAQQLLPADAVWPFFAEHPEYLEEALELRPAPVERDFELEQGLDVLRLFPRIPPACAARVLELALGEGKTFRRPAQAAAARLPDLAGLVAAQLASGKQERRVIAAEWLAELDAVGAVPALQAALKRETSAVARAALLTALEKLGEDIAPFVAPEALVDEARKGLGAKTPAGLGWFPFDALPPARWAAGGADVDPAVLRGWLVLAFKLKQPGDNPLIERYLGLLHPQDAARLGGFVLRAFIDEDTRRPSLDEATAFARAQAPARLQRYRNWVHWHPEYAAKTLEDCFEELKREKLSTCLASRSAAKGILALTTHAPGHEFAALIGGYLHEHPARRAQIEALLDAAGRNEDPAAVQFLLAVAHRHRVPAVQERARTLAEDIAARRGWTRDELADRTVPAAGFDERGEQMLRYGERLFVVTLDAAARPVLRDADGRELKSLPEPRKNDDPGLIREAKARWSACRKELKQVIEQQPARLYEAMCVARVWPAEDWRAYLHAHPIVGRLIQRLIWLRVGADGASTAFRPTEDGALIDADDDEVGLGPGDAVRLAHDSLLDAETRAAWLRHVQDYRVEPLFSQLDRPPLPDGFKNAGAMLIDDRRGWLSDATTLHRRLVRLGYQPVQAGTFAFCNHYSKDFSGVGVRVRIGVSGNIVPPGNAPAALTELCFERLGAIGWRRPPVALEEVPPVLLGEAYADYRDAAAACAGFDPDWERKVFC